MSVAASLTGVIRHIQTAYPLNTMMQLRSVDLEHPAYQMSVDTLMDMWKVRYGTDWIDADAVAMDPNFGTMMHRLHQLGKLEHCHLIDKGQHVCRLPA